jgi:hypothetical protein
MRNGSRRCIHRRTNLALLNLHRPLQSRGYIDVGIAVKPELPLQLREKTLKRYRKDRDCVG